MSGYPQTTDDKDTELARLAATIAVGLCPCLVQTGYGVTKTQESIAREAVNIARKIQREIARTSDCPVCGQTEAGNTCCP